jgi:hypothetical protein
VTEHSFLEAIATAVAADVSGWYVGTVGPFGATVCGADEEFAPTTSRSRSPTRPTSRTHARAVVGQAEALLGEEMPRRVKRYREELNETAVELTVDDRPTVNVVQQESWVELPLRSLVPPGVRPGLGTRCPSGSSTASMPSPSA